MCTRSTGSSVILLYTNWIIFHFYKLDQHFRFLFLFFCWRGLSKKIKKKRCVTENNEDSVVGAHCRSDLRPVASYYDGSNCSFSLNIILFSSSFFLCWRWQRRKGGALLFISNGLFFRLCSNGVPFMNMHAIDLLCERVSRRPCCLFAIVVIQLSSFSSSFHFEIQFLEEMII